MGLAAGLALGAHAQRVPTCDSLESRIFALLRTYDALVAAGLSGAAGARLRTIRNQQLRDGCAS